MVDASQIYVLHPTVAIEDFETTSLALLCDKLRLVQLNSIAREVVRQLDGQTSAGEIAEVIAKGYQQPLDTVLADLLPLLADLEAHQVIEPGNN